MLSLVVIIIIAASCSFRSSGVRPSAATRLDVKKARIEISIGNIMKSVFLFCRFDFLYLRGRRDCSSDEGSSILCLRNDIPKPFSFFEIHHMSLGSKDAPAGSTNIIWNASCQLLGRLIFVSCSTVLHSAALYLIMVLEVAKKAML
jgi:hypothetical protein